MYCQAITRTLPPKALALGAAALLNNGMVLPHAPDPEKSEPRYEDLLVRVGAHHDRDAFIRLFSYFAPRVKSYMLKHGAPAGALVTKRYSVSGVRRTCGSPAKRARAAASSASSTSTE